MSRLVLDGDMLVTQLSPHGDDLCEPFNCVVPLHNSCRHDGDILRDQSCIEAIVLGQDAAGAGELTFARTRSAVLCTVQSGLMGLGRIAPLGRWASAAPPPGGMKSNGGAARLQVRQRLVFLRSDKTTPLQYRVLRHVDRPWHGASRQLA